MSARETLAKLAEESATAHKKAVEVLENAKDECVERLQKMRAEVGLPPKRRNSHSELPAAAR